MVGSFLTHLFLDRAELYFFYTRIYLLLKINENSSLILCRLSVMKIIHKKQNIFEDYLSKHKQDSKYHLKKLM